MAILKQISDSLAYYQGWYGICPEHKTNECSEFSLLEGEATNFTKKYSEILKIELISGNAEGLLGYSGNMIDDFFGISTSY